MAVRASTHSPNLRCDLFVAFESAPNWRPARPKGFELAKFNDEPDHIKIHPSVRISGYRDLFGNWCSRILAPAGAVKLSTEAIVNDSGLPDEIVPDAAQIPVELLPEEAIVFLLPSRFCDSDRLLDLAWSLFGKTKPGWDVRMFRFFGGAPRLLVPDNLRSGVNKASFYDPEINRTYGAMASHYAVGILPARPRKPRDKAKVEAGVRFAQTYILGRLRRQIFFSLAECNAAVALAIQRMNERPMRKLGVSRRELFEKVERDALNPLPAADWEFAEWLHDRSGVQSA